MRTIGFAVLFALSGSTALAGESDHPERLMFLMRLIDEVPTKAQLIEAGAGENGEALVAIARDPSLERYPRMRAAGSLALFDSSASRIALASIIDDGAIEDHEIKIQALVALVWLEGKDARPRLEAMLRDPHPELRAAAARHLKRAK